MEPLNPGMVLELLQAIDDDWAFTDQNDEDAESRRPYRARDAIESHDSVVRVGRGFVKRTDHHSGASGTYFAALDTAESDTGYRGVAMRRTGFVMLIMLG